MEELLQENAATGSAGSAAAARSRPAEPESDTLALLHETSRELTSILDREELLRRMGERVKRLVDYQLFSVMLWHEGRQRLEHVFSLRFGEEIDLQLHLQLGEGLCGTAARERKPVRVANVRTDPRYLECAVGAGVRSELVVPLVFRGRLVGVLDLESTSYNAFSEHHEQILVTLASYIAIALENARLYEDVREKEHRLESDLATARKIQRRLLPGGAPEMVGMDVGIGYRPAHHLGGDFYDFPAYGEGQLAIAVGDVAGKGTAAALYGALAVGTLREHVAEHPCAPAEMLELMNQRLQLSSLPGHFVAMVFAVYDTATQTLRLANSGFPRPLRVRNGRAEPLPVEGVPLGLFPDIRYEEKMALLETDDVVVFCSDGVHEAVNRREEEFGEARLGRIVAELAPRGSAGEIAESILRATDHHAADRGGPDDDRTVVVVKVTGPNRLGQVDPLY